MTVVGALERQPGDLAIQRQLDTLYAELPQLACQRLCAESCGPVFMERVEWGRICRRVGHEPRGDVSTLICPLLVDGRCLVYAIRPMICRLWGVVESMRCPWGCEPERVLTDAEGHDFLRRARELQQPSPPLTAHQDLTPEPATRPAGASSPEREAQAP